MATIMAGTSVPVSERQAKWGDGTAVASEQLVQKDLPSSLLHDDRAAAATTAHCFTRVLLLLLLLG
jgi:hypothetical protein